MCQKLEMFLKNLKKIGRKYKAQREGFEPPEPCGSSAFEADAISQLDHRCMIIL